MVKIVRVMKASVVTLATKVSNPLYRNQIKKKLVTVLIFKTMITKKLLPNHKLSSSALSSENNPLWSKEKLLTNSLYYKQKQLKVIRKLVKRPGLRMLEKKAKVMKAFVDLAQLMEKRGRRVIKAQNWSLLQFLEHKERWSKENSWTKWLCYRT